MRLVWLWLFMGLTVLNCSHIGEFSFFFSSLPVSQLLPLKNCECCFYPLLEEGLASNRPDQSRVSDCFPSRLCSKSVEKLRGITISSNSKSPDFASLVQKLQLRKQLFDMFLWNSSFPLIECFYTHQLIVAVRVTLHKAKLSFSMVLRPRTSQYPVVEKETKERKQTDE